MAVDPAPPCDVSSRLVRGAIVSTGLGVLAAWASRSFHSEQDTASVAGPQQTVLTTLHEYASVCTDSNLYVALQEPVLLFMKLDESGTRLLLRSLDELISIYAQLTQGIVGPGAVASALNKRRRASSQLRLLRSTARQKRPLLASELDEDLDVVQKCLDGYVHNCMQQSLYQAWTVGYHWFTIARAVNVETRAGESKVASWVGEDSEDPPRRAVVAGPREDHAKEAWPTEDALSSIAWVNLSCLSGQKAFAPWNTNAGPAKTHVSSNIEQCY